MSKISLKRINLIICCSDTNCFIYFESTEDWGLYSYFDSMNDTFERALNPWDISIILISSVVGGTGAGSFPQVDSILSEYISSVQCLRKPRINSWYDDYSYKNKYDLFPVSEYLYYLLPGPFLAYNGEGKILTCRDVLEWHLLRTTFQPGDKLKKWKKFNFLSILPATDVEIDTCDSSRLLTINSLSTVVHYHRLVWRECLTARFLLALTHYPTITLKEETRDIGFCPCDYFLRRFKPYPGIIRKRKKEHQFVIGLVKNEQREVSHKQQSKILKTLILFLILRTTMTIYKRCVQGFKKVEQWNHYNVFIAVKPTSPMGGFRKNNEH